MATAAILGLRIPQLSLQKAVVVALAKKLLDLLKEVEASVRL